MRSTKTTAKQIRTSMLVFGAAVLIILGLFGAAFTRPAYTPTDPNAPATDVCAGCHSGTAAAGGSAVVNFPSGLTYTPGVTQHLSVKITDPTHTRGGYILTARMANSVSTQAGSFTATDANSRVIPSGSIQDMDAVNFATLTWNFDWTPPAAGAGNVNFYLIGYATGNPGGCCNGNGAYLSTATLTPGAAGPDFSLSASPSTLSIVQGSNGSSTITVAPLNGFNGSVSLSASGLPSGVTAAFNPASTTTTSSLTLTASATATTGTSTVTITGTSGNLTHTTTVALTVTNPNVSTLTATPTTLSFNYQIGSPVPGPQPISVTGSPAKLSFTASASGVAWLSAAPMSGTTPGTVNVTVNPAGLTAGTYSGSVSIASAGATGSPQTVQVTLMVSVTSTRQLNTTPASTHPSFVMDGKGNYNVVWTDSTAGVFFSRSTDKGTSFPSSVMVPGSTGAALQPQIVVDATGNNVDVVWAQSTSVAGSYNVLFSHSTDGGQHFATAPTSLTLAALPLADAPRMALEPSGGVDVVWGRNETWAIRSANGATFPTPAVKISTAAQDSGGPRVAVDSKGAVYVAWTDEVNKLATGSYCMQTGTSITPAFTNTVGGNFYFNMTASGSTFDPRNTRNLANTDWAGVTTKWPLGFFGCSYNNLILLVDSQDNLHMVWSDDMPDQNVLVSAYSTGSSRISFPTNLGASAAASPHAIVANNSSGIPTLHVVWSDGPSDLNTQATPGIFYTHSTDTSAPFGQSFATPPTRVANAKSEFPQVGVDAGGNIGVAWQQADSLIPNQFNVVLAPSFDGGTTFTLSVPMSINPSTECLGTNTTDTMQIPPPPYNTCGSVQLQVDSVAASNLVWVDSGSNILFARQTIPPPPNFTMTLNTPSQTATSGTATYMLTLTAVNGLNQAVTITCPSGLPAGAGCFSSQVVPSASGTSATVNVVIVGTVPAGTYPFTITGTAGSMTHSVQATLMVGGGTAPDFSVSLTSPSVSSLQGQTASYPVNIAASNGFNNSVSITCAGLPSGATCASSPASVMASGSATVTVAVPGTLVPGTYTFMITGTSGSTNHSQSATLVVGTINATVGPGTSATIPVGRSANFTVSLTSTNGSAGPVNLSCGGVPSGLSCMFSPTQVNLSPSSTATTTMTVTVTAKPAHASVYGWPKVWPNLSTWSIVFSTVFLITLTMLFAYRRNGALPAGMIRGLAVLVLIVVLGAGLISCGGATSGGSGGAGVSSVAAQFMVQGQSGTATINLGTMAITVP
jgi:hypothetical protein